MKTLLPLFLLPLFLTGCATLIDGYEQRVHVRNMNDSTVIAGPDGSVIPVFGRHNMAVAAPDGSERRTFSAIIPAENSYVTVVQNRHGAVHITYDAFIVVRPDREHMFIIRHNGAKHTVYRYPKIGAHWVVLDILTAGIGFVIDGITGNWNEFDDIVL